jgi:hypothetical protein
VSQASPRARHAPPRARHAPPRADAMVEALRGLGYSTPAAVADVIDNSIAASATTITIVFAWDSGNASIAIVDDGVGMSDAELDRAMRLGDRNPLAERAPGDLGRFGLGLKTASFSQCRRLTVASRKDDVLSCLRWDLDVLAQGDGSGWFLLEGADPRSVSYQATSDGLRQGTLVLWEALDRIVTPGFREQNFLDLIDEVERHLSMVFHRYLSGSRPRVRIVLNGRSISPWNPFLVDHESTWSSPIDRIASPGGTVEVQCHVLPHKDRLAQKIYESAAGPHGWTAQQGFYIYRNERLLVAGSWLGLGRGRAWTKEEAHKLARIRLDFPNSADFAWKIDVRKATARPPVEIRERLIRLAEDARERARRVFAYRGGPSPGQNSPVAQAWRAEHLSEGIRYRIDRSHEAVRAVLEAAGPLRTGIEGMLQIVESTVPVQRIWLDTVEAQEGPKNGFIAEPPPEVSTVLSAMFRNLVIRRGVSPLLARQQLLRTEPFHQFPELVNSLPDDPSETE